MGELYRFRCPSCGYSAEVSGGDDVGVRVMTTTIACRACRRLYDMPIAEIVGMGPSFESVQLRCPRADYHPIERWAAGDPCPRCGTPIPRGDATALLD